MQMAGTGFAGPKQDEESRALVGKGDARVLGSAPRGLPTKRTWPIAASLFEWMWPADEGRDNTPGQMRERLVVQWPALQAPTS